MTKNLKFIFLWLLLGPVLALLISFASWYGFNLLLPDKLDTFESLLSAYPLGLGMSVLTPWGWLMYGGLFLLLTNKIKAGLYCSLIGAAVLGIFWPIWSTFLVSAS